MSQTKCIYHVVISTKGGEMVLGEENSPKLYAYMCGILKKMDCFIHAINGIPNHIHILMELPSTLALADVMRELKKNSSIWASSSGLFPMFKGWVKEYGGFSVSFSHVEHIKSYIQGQKAHHAGLNYDDEYKRLILKNGLVFYQYPSDG